jgi:hypothetical protein
VPTANDLISLALIDAGVTGQGQTASAFDSQNALTRLNWLLMQWRQKRWLVYREVTYSVTSTGAQSYTIGPDGTPDITTTVRPDRIESAFARQIVPSQPNLIDYPLELIQSREDYNRIALKSLVSFPQFLFYDSAYPNGSLYPWPVMQANLYQLHVSIKQDLGEIANINDDLELPTEYFRALYLSLAEELATAYQLPTDPLLVSRAAEARNVLRASNAQIARIVLPPELVRPGIYNPYSDRVF